MTTPDPGQSEEQELAERDRATVLNCDHGALELSVATAKYLHGLVHVSILTCIGCPSRVTLAQAEDPRDDMYAGMPLGN